MPVITTIGAMSARGFGFAGGGSGGFWWASFSATLTALGRIYADLTTDHQIVVAAVASGSRIYVGKLTPSGVLVWQNTYGITGGSNSFGGKIHVDGSDDIFVPGIFVTEPSPPGTTGVGVIKVAAAGSSVSNQYLNDVLLISGYSVVSDNSGNIYIVSGGGLLTGTLLKLNSTLTFQLNVGLTLGGGFYVGGSLSTDGTSIYQCAAAGTGPANWALTKWNSSGVVIWSNFITAGSDDNPLDTCVAPSGNVYTVGYVNAGADCCVVCVNSSGVIQWQKILSPSGSANRWECCDTDSVGNLYAGGGCGSGGLLIKYDTNGILLWQRTIATSASDVVYSIKISNNAMVIGLAGASNQIVVRLPTDGSHTGTYGALTYAASSFSVSTPSVTASATGVSASSSTPSAVSKTISVASAAAVATVTGM